jgi:hypothetical protein
MNTNSSETDNHELTRMDTNREERENGATGRSDIEGKGAQGSAEQGGSRANFKTTDDADVRDDEARVL